MAIVLATHWPSTPSHAPPLMLQRCRALLGRLQGDLGFGALAASLAGAQLYLGAIAKQRGVLKPPTACGRPWHMWGWAALVQPLPRLAPATRAPTHDLGGRSASRSARKPARKTLPSSGPPLLGPAPLQTEETALERGSAREAPPPPPIGRSNPPPPLARTRRCIGACPPPPLWVRYLYRCDCPCCSGGPAMRHMWLSCR